MNEQKRENINDLFTMETPQSDDIQKKMYDISDVLNNNFGSRMSNDGVEVIESLNNSSEIPVAAPLIGKKKTKAEAKALKKEQKRRKKEEKIKRAELEAGSAKEKSADEIKVSSTGRTRVVTLVVMVLLCGGAAAAGIYYVNYMSSRAKSGPTTSNAVVVTQETERTTAAPDMSKLFDEEPGLSFTTNDTSAETASTTTEPAYKNDFNASVGDLSVSAYADKNGCHIEWSDSGMKYAGCDIEIALSDGIEGYRTEKTVPIGDGGCTLDGEYAQNAVSARITIIKDGETLASDKFIVENKTYKPENTGTVDIDISGW